MFQENESQPLRNVADGSEPPEELSDKLETAVRHGFVRKVFAIVGVQLALTALISFTQGWWKEGRADSSSNSGFRFSTVDQKIPEKPNPFVFYGEHAKIFIQNNQALLTICMMIPIALICYSFCDPSIAREYPKNYFFLSVITACFGMLVGVSCAMYTTQSVLLVAALTAGIVISLVLFACQTTYDFTGMGPYLFCILMVLCLVSFVMMFLPYSRPMEVAYSGIAALLFSFYIVYDTQLICGGKHSRHRFAVDEYCFAALNLYMDIINLFLHLLRIMGDRR